MNIDLTVYGDPQIEGVIEAPPSKSYTHRYLFLALLSLGETWIENPLKSGDTLATYNAVLKFGGEGDLNRIFSGGEPREPKDIIDCRRSGTTLRISLGVAALVDGETVLDGDTQLRRRPIKPLIKALRNLGVEVILSNNILPAKVRGGKLDRDYVTISSSKSSQFISSLLYLSMKTGIAIEVVDQPVSKGYIDMTISCLREAGVKIYRDGYKFYRAEPTDPVGSRYRVPGDYSSAAYLMVLGVLGGGIVVKGLKSDDPHPDRSIIDILRLAGADVKIFGDRVELYSGKLEPIHVNIVDSPDLLPPLSILAAFINGKSVIEGIRHTKYKESDRPSTIKHNLRAMDIEAYIDNDKIIIYGGKPKPGIFNSYGDHRIAIAFAIAGLLLKGRSIVKNFHVYRDSYPTFLQDIKSLGGRVELKC